jgi:hypothetical protein
MSSNSAWNDGTGDRLDRASRRLREEAHRTPDWQETKNLIVTAKKERKMPYVKYAGLFAYPKKAALVAASTFLMLIFVLAVPFSQEQPLGANITFELADVSLAELEAEYGGPGCRIDIDLDALEADEGLGITDANIQIKCMRNEDGGENLTLDMMVFTESGLVPESLVQRLKEDYPFLADAVVTINPVVERTSGTVFDHLTGDLRVEIDCEGKTPEEIEQEIRAALEAQGVDAADVYVESESLGDGEEAVKIKISVEQEEEIPEE